MNQIEAHQRRQMTFSMESIQNQNVFIEDK